MNTEAIKAFGALAFLAAEGAIRAQEEEADAEAAAEREANPDYGGDFDDHDFDDDGPMEWMLEE